MKPRRYEVVLIATVLTVCLIHGLGGSGRSQSRYSPSQMPNGLESVPSPYRPGELLVKFKVGVSSKRIEEINSALGTKTVRYFKPSGAYLLKITGETSVVETVGQYARLPEVEFAEPNYIRKTQPEDR